MTLQYVLVYSILYIIIITELCIILLVKGLYHDIVCQLSIVTINLSFGYQSTVVAYLYQSVSITC